MPRAMPARLTGAAILAAVLVPGMFLAPRALEAMPTFAQAYGVTCATCHTAVPLLNAYGRYVQRTGYASLDRNVLSRAVPVWIGESANFDSTAGAGTGTPRYSFGNVALHAVGYVAPDVTYHAQQWLTQNDQSGVVDTLWVTYNNLLHRDGHLFIGKILNPAPSPYSQTFDLDGPSASSTTVGEHAWGSTYGNRWGAKLSYVHGALDAEGGYFLSGDDLNGITDFHPGDKTFQWRLAYARPDVPVEARIFWKQWLRARQHGPGPLQLHRGVRSNRSAARRRARPACDLSNGHDGNPGVDANGNVLPASSSRGASVELYEPVLRGNVTFGLRHDLNDDGLGGFGTSNAINMTFNVPKFTFVHGYLEANMGANSSLAGASAGPTWKGMLWLTLPIKAVK